MATRYFALIFGIVYTLIGVMGLIPGLQTRFGLLPLHGADRWLHLASGVVARFFGLTAPRGSELTDNV